MPHSGPRGFWMFFNEVMMGKEQMPKKKCAFTSETNVEQIQEKLSSTLKNFTQEISQSVVQKAEINIRCGGEETTLKDYQLQHRKQEYNIFTGEVKPNSGCLSYGCCFDVIQNSKISLYAINDASASDVSKLENTITSSIVAEMKIKGDCKDNDIKAVQETVLKQKLKNEEIITQEIRKNKISETQISQKIDLNYDEPLLCINQCDQAPSAGEIRQISNVDIMTRNMIKSVIKNIEKNVITAKVESEMDIDMREDPNTELMWSIYSAAIIIGAYFLTLKVIAPLFWTMMKILCKVLGKIPVLAFLNPVGVMIGKVQDKAPCVLYSLTTYIFMYLYWRFWKFGYCVHKSSGFVETLMCFWRPLLVWVAFIPIPPPCGICLLCKIWCPNFMEEPCECIANDCMDTKGEKCNKVPLPQ